VNEAFLRRAGSTGPIGALMDEYARAAEDLCRVVERFDASTFLAERPSDDPDTRSPRTICEHVVFACVGYANYLRRMQGLPAPTPESEERKAQRVGVPAPSSFRPALGHGVRSTEEAVEGLRDRPFEEVAGMALRVGWGALYDPESMLEHAIVHLLRHRRQLERWAR
jgi:hypothetical protein